MILCNDRPIEEVLEEGFAALVEQGGQCMASYPGFSGCAYGNDKGQHCLVGLFLPEEDDRCMSFQGDLGELLASGIDLGQNHDYIEEHKDVFYLAQTLHDRPRTAFFGSPPVIISLEGLIPDLEDKVPSLYKWLEIKGAVEL